MKAISRITASFLSILILCTSFACFALPDLSNYSLNCKSAVIINTDTGRVIYEKAPDEQMSIASTTKIMTAICVMENCADLEAEVTVEYNSLLRIGNTGLVTAGLKTGEKMSVVNLLHCLLMASAADASVVLADYISDFSTFVDTMNQKAKSLGLNNTHFVDTHGFHEKKDGHYSTASDLAKLAQYAMKNELFASIVAKSSYTVPKTNLSPERNLVSTNYLIMPNSSFYYDGACGIKTGYTSDAGRCLVSFCKRDKVNYVCVVLGCDSYDSSGALAVKHFTDSIYLYEQAYNNYNLKKLCKTDKVMATVHDKCFGIDADVVLVPAKAVSYLVKDGEKVKNKITLDSETLSAPVEKGQKLGVCRFYIDGKQVGKVSLVAQEAVQRDVTKMAITILLWVLAGLVVCFIVVILVITLSKKKSRSKGRMRRTVKYK